jgi:tryptophan 2,3-dioxygenase
MTDTPRTDFTQRMSYSDYLALDPVLTAQHPLSDAHDELLFIIQHQTSELWMKLAIHELDAARAAIDADRLDEAFKLLARVCRIFEQLNNAWDGLRTMTPSDYTTFRDALGQSSGFQSVQYRRIEFILGNRNRAMLKPHAHRPDLTALLEAELARPCLYVTALRAAIRSGLALPDMALEQAREPGRDADPVITALWAEVYRDPARHWPIYELAEKLVDLEDAFRQWRFRHVTTVERIIGLKRGTGGTSGVGYLRGVVEVELFPELWRARTEL